MDIGLTA